MVKLLAMAVTVVIAVLMVGSILFPVVSSDNDALYTTDRYENTYSDNQIFLSPVDAGTSNTINASASGITTNNGHIALWSDASYGNIILIVETMYVVMSGSGSIIVRSTTDSSVTASSFTAVISAGEITYSIDAGDAKTITYSKGYVADPNGSFTSVLLSNTPYIQDEYAQARQDGSIYVYLDGAAYANGASTAMTVIGSDVEGTDGSVKQLTQIKYTTSKALNSQVVVPAVVEYSYPKDDQIASLVGIIPILILAGLVVGIATAIYRRSE